MPCSYFFAFFPGVDERVALHASAAHTQKLCELDGRLIVPEKLHMTLAFVGRFPTRVLELESRLRHIGDLASIPSGQMVFDRAQSLGSGAGVKPFVFTASETPLGLADVSLALNEACADLRNGQPHPWLPHVTWLYSPDSMPHGMLLAPTVEMKLHTLTLVVSEYGRAYDRIAEWPARPRA